MCEEIRIHHQWIVVNHQTLFFSFFLLVSRKVHSSIPAGASRVIKRRTFLERLLHIKSSSRSLKSEMKIWKEEKIEKTLYWCWLQSISDDSWITCSTSRRLCVFDAGIAGKLFTIGMRPRCHCIVNKRAKPFGIRFVCLSRWRWHWILLGFVVFNASLPFFILRLLFGSFLCYKCRSNRNDKINSVTFWNQSRLQRSLERMRFDKV